LFIYSFFNKHQLINKKNTPISYAFYELCKDMMEILDQQEKKYIDISNFKNEFGSKHSIFGGYLQNDSQEFFRILLEDISTELNEVSNKSVYRALTNSDTTKTKQLRDIEFDKNFSEREKSIVTDLFYAQLITTFTCHCSHRTYSFQKILDFPLLLPQNKSNVNIYDLLKHKLITSRIYNALRIYYKWYIDNIENHIDDECKNIPQIKELLINKPSECNVRFIKFLFYATAYNKPLIRMVKNLGKDSITILADTLGYQKGSSKEIDSLIYNINKIKRDNVSNKIESLKAAINNLNNENNEYIDSCLNELDELKDLLNNKRK
jgi:hypothetical protein